MKKKIDAGLQVNLYELAKQVERQQIRKRMEDAKQREKKPLRPRLVIVPSPGSR